MLVRPAGKVVFASDPLEKSFLSLAENSPLRKSIQKAITDLKENAFCGENIPKNLIPKEYIKKYAIDNLWWYPLANAWRLVYSLSSAENIRILAIIIDYSNHKEYERKFGY